MFLFISLFGSNGLPLTNEEFELASRRLEGIKTKPDLVDTAISFANEDLLRIALFDSKDSHLEAALTASRSDLLKVALQESTPDNLRTALTKANIPLLAVAVTKVTKQAGAELSHAQCLA